jgi:deoxyribonuclease (pyrimidine dimer)
MTRINVVDVTQLTDQHLMAEYRELPMVAGSLRRSLRSKRGLPAIPDQYVLGRNHVTFFYNKGKFLHDRYNALVAELISRGYKLDPNREADFDTFINNGLYNDWNITDADVSVNSSRLSEKLTSKLGWYKYYSQPLAKLDAQTYNNLLNPNKKWQN